MFPDFLKDLDPADGSFERYGRVFSTTEGDPDLKL